MLFVGFGLVVSLVTACSGTRATEPSRALPSDRARGAHGRVVPSQAGWLDHAGSARADRDVLAAVTHFWSAYATAADHPGGFDEQAVRAVYVKVATGASLERLVTVARTNAAAGIEVRGTVISHTRVSARAATEATVIDCVDDRTGAYRQADGSRIDTNDPAWHRATLRVVHRRVGWLVSEINIAEQPCIVP